MHSSFTDFERGWFESVGMGPAMSAWSTLFFVLNTFIVMIIALSMLITIVSDSYEYAQIRASKLFLRTRVELATELVAIGTARSRLPTAASALLGRVLAPMKRVLQLSAEPPDSEDLGGGGGGDDEWQGRALEMDRRTQAAVRDSRVQLEARFGEMNTRFGEMDMRFGEMDTRFGRIEKRLTAAAAAAEEKHAAVLAAVLALATPPPPS